MSTALTKKQQKALAFRSKQKAKRSGKEDIEPQDVPEQDPIEDDADIAEAAGVDVDGPGVAESSKKRKREDDKSEAKVDVKGKGKGKARNAWEEEEGGDGEKAGKKSKKEIKKEIKQRFILFVGNLGFKTTKEEVQAHFAEAAGQKPDVRLLTAKPEPKSTGPPKSRGIAFLEVPSSTAMQACLKLHHSSIQNRRINVELTAGGGGKSDARQGKIKERNDRVGGQRERRAEKEKEAGVGEQGVNGGVVIPTVETDARPRNNRDRGTKTDTAPVQKPREVEVVREDGPMTGADGSAVKVRGGRRTKVKPEDGRSAQRPRPDNGGYQNRSNGPQGRGGFQGGASRGGAGGRGGFGRSKFELTGANAIGVQRS